MVALMIYWVAALSGVGGALEILILPLPTVLFDGVFWALVARWTLAIAERRKDCPLSGPGTQVLAMAILFFPVILVAVVVPWMLELNQIWSAVSLIIVGVLLSAVIADPLRGFLLEWGKLSPEFYRMSRAAAEHLSKGGLDWATTLPGWIRSRRAIARGRARKASGSMA